MRFKVGDKVIVKSFSERPVVWNILGGMDKWMGKIVTIRKYQEDLIAPYSIEEDKEENIWDGWNWRESDFLPIPKPGDRVKLRTWEDMKKQYREQIIDPDLPSCISNCLGKICTVSLVYNNYFCIKQYGDLVTIKFEAIEDVYPKEEKMVFTKDMLKSGEHVVVYRNGSRRLYLNGYFIGLDESNDLSFYEDILKNCIEELDVMAIYKAKNWMSFKNILSLSNELIWKRDEEPIEIPSSEAFAKLKEIYGKEVKIVEDKND